MLATSTSRGKTFLCDNVIAVSATGSGHGTRRDAEPVGQCPGILPESSHPACASCTYSATHTFQSRGRFLSRLLIWVLDTVKHYVSAAHSWPRSFWSNRYTICSTFNPRLCRSIPRPSRAQAETTSHSYSSTTGSPVTHATNNRNHCHLPTPP